MKKTLIAMATLGAFAGLALAESQVTLYGVIDAGVVVQNAKTSGKLDKFGAKTWDTPTTVSLNSGFRTGSRWGIKGTEDLGGGNSVGFVLEQGFNFDNGGESSAGTAFYRESTLQASGNWGKVGFGRFGVLSSGTGSFNMLTGWSLGTSFTQGSWNSFAGTLRANNAIGYLSPNFGGLQIGVAYSNGTTTDDARWSDNSHYYGIGAKYVGHGLTSSLIFDVVDNKGATKLYYVKDSNPKTTGIKQKALYTVNFGLEYAMGPITPMFAYQFQNQNDWFQAHTFGLSLAANVGGGKAMLGTRYRLMKTKGETKDALNNLGLDDKGNIWTINAAYEYPLSKRTTLWTYAGWAIGNKLYDGKYLAASNTAKVENADGDDTAYLAVPGAKIMSTASDAVIYNGWAIGIGMTHTF